MRVWAISDLHLSLGGNKPMDRFGAHWERHHQRVAEAWDAVVAAEDLVLSPGDFSWAMKAAEVAPDFAWLEQRPGLKVLIKGNHDYWWPKTRTRMADLLPSRTWALKRNALLLNGLGIFGARGGDFAPLTRYGDTRSPEEIENTLLREQDALCASLQDLSSQEAAQGPAHTRICLFHYPPLLASGRPERFHRLITAAGAAHCIYGHLHGAASEIERYEDSLDGVSYRCASCDLLDFRPLLVCEFPTSA